MGERVDIGDAEVAVDQAAEAFRTLGDPTRVAIIVELVIAGRSGDAPLSFAELRRRTGIDDSGRFNYHLDQLQPRFVESTDDGYSARYAASLANALVQSRAAPSGSIELETPIDRPCLLCDEPPVAHYGSDRLTIRCETTDEQLMGIPVPPSIAADGTMDDIVSFAEVQGRNHLLHGRQGRCADCWSSVERYVDPVEFPPDAAHHWQSLTPPLQAYFDCDRCQLEFSIPLRVVVGDHPTIVAFHHDHGVAIDGIKTLRDFSAMLVESTEVTDDGAVLMFAADDDRLEVEVDDSFAVVDVTRMTADDPA